MSEEKAKSKPEGQSAGTIAVIRVRGKIGVNYKIKDTLTMLNLHRVNFMSVYPDTPKIRGMIHKVKDFVTYGQIDPALFEEVKKARGEKDPKDPKLLKKYFRLNPPKKGYGREGIKKVFSVGGALGDRKEQINDLIRRMM